MGRIKVTLTFIFSLLFLALLPNAGSAHFGASTELDDPFPPQLIYPNTDEADISGKDSLEFRWDIRDTGDTRYYDFYLYKGYDTYVSNLILKQRLVFNTFTFKVSADQFEDNQVYTWVLRRATLAGRKSEPSFNSFRVIKKPSAEKQRP